MAKEDFFSRRPWVLHLLYMLAASVVILIAISIFINIYARKGEEYTLGDIVGLNIDDAKQHDSIGITIVIMDSIFQKDKPAGTILMQDPKPGTLIKQGRKVYVTVSRHGVEGTFVPELSGLTVRQAISELRAVGLDVGVLTFVESPYKNSVIDFTTSGRTLKAGDKLNSGTLIDLKVGLGDGKSHNVVPFVIGKTQQQARRDILSASLNVGKQHFNNVRDRKTAVVYRQEPDYTGATRYDLGTKVELWYIDADDIDVLKMVNDFKVDSSKIVRETEYNDGRPSADEIEANPDWQW